MAASKFPWLSDLEPDILAKIDQKRRTPGQKSWDRAELSAAYNAEHKFLFERISSMDKGFSLTIDDTLSTDGTETTDLPAGCRALRQVFVIDSSGKVLRSVDVGAWHELVSGDCRREALYRPYPQADLFWTKKPPAGVLLRCVFDSYPPHLFHGCVQGAASSVIQVESFEPIEDSVSVGREFLINENEGAGAVRTVTAYAGTTREITVSAAYTTIPTTRSRYTQRPALPLDSREAYFYGVCARLVEKFRDGRFEEFSHQRMEKLSAMFTALGTLDRRGPLDTYDLDTFGHGDPAG